MMNVKDNIHIKDIKEKYSHIKEEEEKNNRKGHTCMIKKLKRGIYFFINVHSFDCFVD